LDTNFSSQFTTKKEIDAQISQIMSENSINNATIVTISNYGFRNFTLNWIESLKRNEYQKFVVFSFDLLLVDFLGSKGYGKQVMLVPREWLDFNITSQVSNFKEDYYMKIMKSKTHVVYNLLVRDFTFLYSDSDVIWLSEHVLDHIQFQYKHSFADLLYSQDTSGRRIDINAGFFYATPTPYSIRIFQKVIQNQRLDTLGRFHDQQILNKILMHTRFNDCRLETLDFLLFAGGKLHFTDRLNTKMNIRPLIVHATYMFSAAEKIFKLKSRKYWYV
jgi:hypothetical protein